MVLGMVHEALKGAVADVRSGVTAKEKIEKAASLTRTIFRELIGIFSGVSYAVFTNSVWRKPEQYQQRWHFNLLRNVRYGLAERNLLDVYTPSSCTSKSSLPVLMFVHGGVWASGDKSLFSPIGAILAHHGVIALLVQYTLYPQVPAKEQVKEISRAFSWAQDNVNRYGGNPDKVHIMGHSSGAHLCGMLLWERARRNLSFKKYVVPSGESTDARQPRCYIGLSGVYNIGEHYKYETGRGVAPISCMNPAMEGPKHFSSMSPELLFRSLLSLKFNQQVQNMDMKLEDLNTKDFDWNHWANSLPPFIPIASDNDITVPPGTSINFSNVLQELGCKSGVTVYETLNHDDFVCWVTGFKGEENLAAQNLIKNILDIVKEEEKMAHVLHSEVLVTD
ncbi:hypothetical protein Mapa_011799 [Marchantia paleacea]|nr:hypothetical protein Mapa_011799 [Marchantia paleacea]